MLSLIFFASHLSSCKEKQEKTIDIIWKNNRATGIEVPMHLLIDADKDSPGTHLHVSLESKPAIAMLGEYSVTKDAIIFSPLVPLSRGLSYEIFYKGKIIGKITVPPADARGGPELISVYPKSDTLPENLLKVYLQFSAPMREGSSLKHIVLVNDLNDTLPETFLDLQPELWNKASTTLTLWLDPGRIKRDLLPNLQHGNPLIKGKRYKIVVLPGWKDQQGRALPGASIKLFTVGPRDSLSPDPQQWHLKLPETQSLQPLEISFGEPLDFFLVSEALTILNENGNLVAGRIQVKDGDRFAVFIPHHPWQEGNYKLVVAAHLEDLAGNNLERPFDRDLHAPVIEKSNHQFERSFQLPAAGKAKLE